MLAFTILYFSQDLMNNNSKPTKKDSKNRLTIYIDNCDGSNSTKPYFDCFLLDHSASDSPSKNDTFNEKIFCTMLKLFKT